MMGARPEASGRAPTASRTSVRAWITPLAAALFVTIPRAVLAQPEGLTRPQASVEVGPSGLTLMVVAYSAIWLVAFVFVVMTLKRQARLADRVDRLESLLTDRARSSDPSVGSDRDAPDVASAKGEERED